jgi:hypothetical protein
MSTPLQGLLAIGGLKEGRFLVRKRGAEHPKDYVMSVVFKGRATHHLMTPNAEGLMTVNKKTFGSDVRNVKQVMQAYGHTTQHTTSCSRCVCVCVCVCVSQPRHIHRLLPGTFAPNTIVNLTRIKQCLSNRRLVRAHSLFSRLRTRTCHPDGRFDCSSTSEETKLSHRSVCGTHHSRARGPTNRPTLVAEIPTLANRPWHGRTAHPAAWEESRPWHVLTVRSAEAPDPRSTKLTRQWFGCTQR